MEWLMISPNRPITLYNNESIPAWFDIIDRSDAVNRREDEAGMLESLSAIGALVDGEIEGGIPASRIVIGGERIYRRSSAALSWGVL
jgi:phospholipase/carboxylesterase